MNTEKFDEQAIEAAIKRENMRSTFRAIGADLYEDGGVDAGEVKPYVAELATAILSTEEPMRIEVNDDGDYLVIGDTTSVITEHGTLDESLQMLYEGNHGYFVDEWTRHCDLDNKREFKNATRDLLIQESIVLAEEAAERKNEVMDEPDGRRGYEPDDKYMRGDT